MELFSYVLLSLDEETSQTIATLTKDGDGIMAWREVQKLFKKNDPLNISNLREEIQELRLEEGGDVGLTSPSTHHWWPEFGRQRVQTQQ